MKFFYPLVLALNILGSGLFAQTPGPRITNLQQGVSPTALQYTMGEGYQVIPNAQRSGPETIFNTRSAVLYYYGAVFNTDELVDEGSLRFEGVQATEQINGITFDYCSSLADPNGNLVTAELRFYAEVIAFQGIVGWVDANNRNEACGYALAGLPGNVSGGWADCWTVHLDLSGGYECTLPQEQSPGSLETFGWSTMYLDANNSAQTGMAAATIFSPTYPQHGTHDWFEFYDNSQPLGSEYLGTYWFGSTNPRALLTWWLAFEANPTDTSAYYSANPGAADTVDLQADVAVRAGQAAGWNITNPSVGMNYALIASTSTVDRGGFASGNAHLLVNWLGNPLLPAPIVMPGGAYGQILPAVLPPNIHVQAAEYTGALNPGNVTAMSNGLTHSN